MVRTLLILVSLLALLSAPAAARGRPTKFIEVYVAVPADTQTTVTSAQAVQTIQRVLGSPMDAPCLGRWSPYDRSTWNCTVEGWFRHELGQVFDYRITVVNIPAIGGPVDACGSWSSSGLYFSAIGGLLPTGATFTKQDRAMIFLLGGGGWAGHFSPADHVDYHFGMVGDWGAMSLFNQQNACLPAEYDEPSGGLSHEFAGMMGEYVTAGYNEGGLFAGEPMSVNEKSDLLRYSRQWLRSP
jgi:hypothetical protein